ncbi:MAG: hypothetical protein CFH19_01069 [Alphaproteobacteria bacterium MarineAlpha5_Bin9]|nr:MAG: hypothetical protein CFH19_01069 [Alphaproteobacteria bacterium MarineAlpha5_Bin9]|tara:strand:- start:7528 stop:8469 length:942 start_codon:yes stop_codon:yes gene_type:complete
MIEIIISTIGVFIYIFIGFSLKKLKLISVKFEIFFTKISFNILLPIALVINFWQISFPEIYLFNFLIAFFGSGTLIFFISFLVSKKLFKFRTDQSAVFGFSSCFGNSVALGIPLMYTILGPIKAMPYMILVLFHGIIYFTYTTLIIENYRSRDHKNLFRIFRIILGLLKNIVLFGMFLGLFFSFIEVPFPKDFATYLNLIPVLTLPTVLISLGLALANFKLNIGMHEIFIITFFKNILQPFVAFITSKYLFQMSNELVLIITLASALPSGSQTYYLSYRYNTLQKTISANIVLSTFLSFFTLSILIYLFNFLN